MRFAPVLSLLVLSAPCLSQGFGAMSYIGGNAQTNNPISMVFEHEAFHLETLL